MREEEINNKIRIMFLIMKKRTNLYHCKYSIQSRTVKISKLLVLYRVSQIDTIRCWAYFIFCFFSATKYIYCFTIFNYFLVMPVTVCDAGTYTQRVDNCNGRRKVTFLEKAIRTYCFVEFFLVEAIVHITLLVCRSCPYE